jgi:hypothetical protein
LYAWHGDGTAVSGFPTRPLGFTRDGTLYHDLPFSPVLADYDGDGITEILVSIVGAWGVTVVEPNGITSADRSHLGHVNLLAAPLVDDVDSDGKLETLVGAGASDLVHGEVIIWEDSGGSGGARPWPTFHHDMRRTGNVWGTDTTPPTNPTLSSASHTVSTWSNDDIVQVDIAGAADDDSGVAGFFVRWDTTPGASVTAADAFVGVSTTTLTSDPLPNGDSHFFHLRTVDRAGNLAADSVHLGPFWIDTLAPASSASSPPFAAGSVPVSWQGGDAGPSGLAGFDVQVREGAGGAWTTWLDDVSPSTTQGVFTGKAGTTYWFRSVARDQAGNIETTPDDGDASTAVTAYAFTGNVYNNREEPVFLADVQSTPAVVGALRSDIEGAYGLFFNASGDYHLSVVRNGYSSYPPRSVNGGSLDDLDFYLPPAPDLVQDGGFEFAGGSLGNSSWDFQGSLVPFIRAPAHSGAAALQITGQGQGIISQTVALPGGAERAPYTLSWMVWVEGNATAGDRMTAELHAGGVPTSLAVELDQLGSGAWKHGFLTVDAQPGQQVSLSFKLELQGGIQVRLDEVSFGVTAPGVNRVLLPLIVKGGAR